MELIALTNLCGQIINKNLGIVHYAPVQYFDPMNWDWNPMARVDKLFSGTVFKSGKGWLSMPVIINNKNIESTVFPSQNNDSIVMDLSLFIPGYGESVHNELAKMLHIYFIIKLKLGDATYIIGDINYPLKLSYKIRYGSRTNIGIDINFSGTSPAFARKVL
jgi:hypothetical protein